MGDAGTVELALSNHGRMPAGLLLLEDRMPYVLGHRPRFVVDRVSRDGVARSTYPVRSDVRGRYPVGPLMRAARRPVRAGASSPGRSPRSTAPAGHAAGLPLPEIRLGGDGPASATAGRGRSPSAGEDDVDRPRVPRRRRPAPGALALDGPPRRADGPARGAALAEPVHDVPGRADDLAPRARTVVQPRMGGQRGRLDRHRPDPPRLRHDMLGGPTTLAAITLGRRPPSISR